MSFKFFFVLFFTIGLVCSQSPGTKTRSNLKTSDKDSTETSSDTINLPDYGPIIEKIQNDLKNIPDLTSTLSTYNKDLSNFKLKLSELSNKLTAFEQKQSEIKTIENSIDSTNSAINKLSSRIKQAESNINSVTSSSTDTSLFDEMNSKINTINENINKLSKSMSREISDNTQRLETIEENSNQFDSNIENIKKELKQLKDSIKRSDAKYDNTFKQIRDRFDHLDKSISDINKNMQIIYDSTVGAAMDKLLSNILDYLADFGEFCVNLIERIKNKIMTIDWNGQIELFKDWVYGVYKYVSFWWINGIQPAILRQVTNLYFEMQVFVKDGIKSIHASFVYTELMEQAKPYLKMGNVPMEYNGYIIDGLLVLFFISSLITLSFIIGLCCDCCCPVKKQIEPPSVGMNGRKGVDHHKKKKKKRHKGGHFSG